MAFPFKSSKRAFDRNSLDQDGKGKWQKTTHLGVQQNQLKTNPGATVFRILCPAAKSGSVIGKGGGIITKIRQETGAKIKIEEIIPGCEERVVVIAGPDREVEDKKENAKKDNEDDDDANVNEDNQKAEDEPPQESSSLQPDKTTSAAQKALLLVFERIAECDPESDPVDDEGKKSSVVVRVLVLSNQVGCILGKGGSVVKQLAAESGAHIRIMPRDKVPACASPLDELVQITGSMDAARKALQSISQQLIENPPRDRDILPQDRIPGSAPHHFELFPPANFMADFHPRMGPPVSQFRDIAGPIRVPVSPEILSFHLICSCEKVGRIIGKGGNMVKVIQAETNSEIRIAETTPDSDDRIVVISGPAHPDDRVSPVQDAVLRVQSRIAMAAPDDKEQTVSTRIIVSSTQTGCLLGRGGSIVSEMRKLSGAQIRVLGRDQSPNYTSDNEVVVQVSGRFEAVQEALFQITTRLKHHIFDDKYSGGRPIFADQALLPFPSFFGGRELSPPDPHSSFFRGLPHNERFPFPPRMMPSASWAAPGIGRGDGLIGIDDYEGGPRRQFGGFQGGAESSRTPATTIDVVVPRALVPVIRGEDGGCLREICQISGANVTIVESRAGASETVIRVFGTPDQTHAAQSLIQAFVSSESRPS